MRSPSKIEFLDSPSMQYFFINCGKFWAADGWAREVGMLKRMRTLGAQILCLAMSHFATAADAPVMGENMAIGKPYTMSSLIADQWAASFATLPDYGRLLTDGVKESGPSFWVSPRCVNFTGASYVDIRIDLGSVQPVGGVNTRHGARPGAGIALPRLEEYFVSDDGRQFYKVGQHANTRDDYSLISNDEMVSKFFSGVAGFSSGPIRARGRYLLVRTYGSGKLGFPTYVGYDEIEVIRGRFSIDDVPAPTGAATATQPEEIPAALAGYRIRRHDWRRIASEQPMFLALAPMQYLGDDEYYLSAGGVYVLTFSPTRFTRDTVTDVKFECQLPDPVEVISYNTYNQLTRSAPVDLNGRRYVSYSFSLKDDFADAYTRFPYLVVRAKGKAPGLLGDALYRYSYSAGGKQYERSRQFHLVLTPKIEGAAPHRYLSTFWLPYQTAQLDKSADTIEQLFAFYQSLGFNGINGGANSPGIYSAAKKRGMTVWGETGIGNGMMLKGVQIPAADRFQYHPDKSRPNVAALCPTLMYRSEKYRDILKSMIEARLASIDQAYSNWEPYMFQKQGCVCDRCKREFAAFTGLSAAEVDVLWPGVVIDTASGLHNRFSSFQFANIIRTLQELTRQAGAGLRRAEPANFIIAFEPSYITPGHLWSRVHDPAEFYRDVGWLCMWSYPNTVDVFGADIEQLAGNTLTELKPAIEHLHAQVRNVNRFDATTPLPRALFMTGECFGKYDVLPRDHYFSSLLSFFGGLSGSGTWTTHFMLDARSMTLRSRANGIMSAFEDVVTGGSQLSGIKATHMSPATASIKGKPITTLAAYGWQRGTTRVVAVGNDYPRRVYVKVSVAGLPAGEYRLADYTGRKVYRKEGGAGYTARELAAGVSVVIEAKEWAVLDIGAAPSGSGNWEGVTEKMLIARLAAETADLNAFADRLR
jgi:hypothetical protein